MRLPAVFFALIAVSATVALSPATAATPKLRTFKGTIGAVAKDHRSLRLKRTGKPSVRFSLRRSTKVTGYGFTRATLTKGLVVRVTARKGKRGYTATKVEVDPSSFGAEPPVADPLNFGEDNGF